VEEWREEAKTIAVAGYRRVLEDGPEFCSSETSVEYSDHGDELTGMYAPDLLDEHGKPVLARATLTTEQANVLRNEGMAGGLGTVSGAGRQDLGSGNIRSE
jgi:hypothetical protein